MAEIICSFEEFCNIIGPKVRNDVASVTKQKKKKLYLTCQHCNNKVGELEAAHKHGSSRNDIIESVLAKYKSEEGKYNIQDLNKVLNIIKEYHKSNDVFFFLCKSCHHKYDNEDSKKPIHPSRNNTGADNLKQSILVIFEENPTESYTAGGIFERIQERDQKYYSDTLWGLCQQGFLIRPKRGKYQWNMER